MSFFEEGDEAFDVFKEGETFGQLIQQHQEELNKQAERMQHEDIQEVLDEIQEVQLNAEEVKKNYKIEEFEIEYTKEEGSCTHEVFKPKDWVKPHYEKKPPALEYKFTLDPFQKQSIDCIEQNESVLVSAHTSAGKTAIAEYAIAKSLRDKQRVIYTSPIKALSNQKYRELSEKFKDVGLITGDVTQNQNSSCLVMTTEILRSMLYRGSEIAKEIAWVIFDEVHYMRDKERGVVWEETMILCSPNIRYVFLSATIPNAKDFAHWICKIKRQPCHVVYTEHRPIPLQHYIMPAGGKGLYLIVDEKGQFREDNFKKSLSSMSSGAESFLPEKKKKRKETEGSDLNKVLKLVIERKYDPVIVFSFSKKEVEGYAMAMTKFDMTSEEEKQTIITLYENAMSSLSTDDRELPQIQQMKPILKKGIGIHHGGFLPIVKEIIEIMFQMGLLKVLFSTETFSMGLNMPARTVVFTAVRKFDGEEFRWLRGGEYIQMSGRAGRRGIDDKGIAILMVDEKMEPEIAKGMLKGKADALHSSFYLNYNMLINSMKIEDTDPEYIIRRSFHQFEKDLTLPEIESEMKLIEERLETIKIENEQEIEQIYFLKNEYNNCQDKIREIITQPINILPYLSIGRMVKIDFKDEDWGWGAIINFSRRKMMSKGKKKQEEGSSTLKFNYVIDVMLHIRLRKNKGDKVEPAKIHEKGEMEIIPMLLSCVKEISSVVLALPNDLIKKENKLIVRDTFKEVTDHFKGELPLMDPLKDMKIDNEELTKNMTKAQQLRSDEQKIRDKASNTNIKEDLENYTLKQRDQKKLRFLKEKIDQGGDMILQEELNSMKRVMRRLKLIDKNDIVLDKGRVAGEISSCDEIMLTELILSGFFNDMTPEEIAAILSSLINDEKGGDKKFVIKNENLTLGFQKILSQAERLFEVYKECRLDIDKESYLNTFNPQLIDVAYQWCQGATFGEICKMTDCYEGSIIRCFRRLEELLKELCNCAKVMGNHDLQGRFEEASNKLRRGIIFAASLYL